MKTHYLKIYPEYFKLVCEGKKAFEIRKNDRGFAVGDVVHLGEYDPVKRSLTGVYIAKTITYIIHGGQFGIIDGWCVLNLGEAPKESGNYAETVEV